MKRLLSAAVMILGCALSVRAQSGTTVQARPEITRWGGQSDMPLIGSRPPRVHGKGLGTSVAQPPTITGISPTYGLPGTSIIISGTGFGSSQGNGYVFVIPGVSDPSLNTWPVASWSDTQVVVTVPSNMPLGGELINVNVNGTPSVGVYPFDVGIPPLVAGTSPSFGGPGTIVNIHGSNFGQTQGGSYVNLLSSANLMSWPVISWSDTQIVAQVPSNMPLTGGFINVFANGFFSIGVVPFTVGTPPLLSGVSPTYGSPGTVVDIYGSNFGSAQEHGYVFVRSSETGLVTNWPVISWSDTVIVAQVPTTMPLGNVWVNVSANGFPSLGMFVYEVGNPPIISSYTPLYGEPGTTVNINGTGFGSTQDDGWVYSYEILTNKYTEWPTVSWSDTQIVAQVPSNMPLGKIYLFVEANDLYSQGWNSFTVGAPPLVRGTSPAYGNPGTFVTINGSGFGQTQGSSYVSVVLADKRTSRTWPVTTSWSDSQIVVQIPSDMPLGIVYPNVFANNLWSLGVIAFTVGTPPLVTDASPRYGKPGTVVTISGSGFGQTQGTGYVNLLSSANTVPWTVISWSDTQITAQVPSNMPPTGGFINVFANGLYSLGVFPFYVGIPPIVAGISPTYGNPGTVVTISGSGFGQTQSGGYVNLLSSANTMPWTVISWSDTQIVAQVPTSMPMTGGFVNVFANGLYSLGVFPFYVGIPPMVARVSPTSGSAGTVVTISGSGFGQTQVGGFVDLLSSLNPIPWTVISWSDTEIIAEVPNNMPATGGFINVFAGGMYSLGVFPFNVVVRITQ